MKDKTKVKDRISFVLNGEPVVRDEPKLVIDERLRVREHMERLQRQKKKQEEND